MKRRIFYDYAIVLALLFTSIIGCNTKASKNAFVIEKKDDGKTIVKGKWEAFPIGDIDNDKLLETAFVYTPAYYGRVNPELPKNDTIEFEGCVGSKCYNSITFSNKFPSILVENSLWGSIESIEDLDGDGIKELIFQSNWFIGTHVEIYIYSFDRNKRTWTVLAKNNLYGQESYKDRVTKIDQEKFRFKIEYMDTIEHDLLNKEIVVQIRK